MGGIVGQNAAKGYVGYCYSIGTVSLTGEGTRVGGVVGYNITVNDSDPLIKGSFCLDNTEYSIGQVGVTTSSGGITGNVCTKAYLTSESFATTINNGAWTYNSVNSPTIEACAWIYNSGSYPTLNFGTTQEDYNSLDISYNSISYNINNEKGLLAFAALVNGTAMPDGVKTSGNDIYFQFGTPYSSIDGKLTDNIDLTNVSWTSIGTESNPYSGTFDFNSKTISGITIIPSSNYSTLFGFVDTETFSVTNFMEASN